MEATFWSELYRFSNYTAWTTLIILGLCMLGRSMPVKATFNKYRIANRYLATAFIFHGSMSAVIWFGGFRHSAPEIASAFSLSTFFIDIYLFSYGFLTLLDRKYPSRKEVKFDLGAILTFATVVWVPTIFLPPMIRKVCMTLAIIAFLVIMLYKFRLILRHYNRACAEIDEYYSDDVALFVKWITRSIAVLILFGMPNMVLAFGPVWILSVYAFVGTAVFCYIFINFENYAINIDSVETAINRDELEVLPVSLERIVEEQAAKQAEGESVGQSVIEPIHKPRVNTFIKTKVDEWITNEGYCQSGVNIENLSLVVGTNRTYLSSYINSEYGCSFRAWVTGLRIDKVKGFLSDKSNNKTIAEIAAVVGFSSSAHLTQVFTQRESISPTKWRQQRC